MRISNPCLVAAILLFSCLGAWPASADDTPEASPSAREVVEELYRLVTFEAGETPDWSRVRSLFVDDAVVVLRTGRDAMTVFTVDGFVDDFVQFIEQREVEKTGFTERILEMKSTVYGDIAHILVLFDSHIPGSEAGPPSPGNPIPDDLFR